MRLCISIRGCVSPSVRPSIRPVLFTNNEYGRLRVKSHQVTLKAMIQWVTMKYSCIWCTIAVLFFALFCAHFGPNGQPHDLCHCTHNWVRKFYKNYLSWFHSHRFKLFRSSCRWLQAGFFLKISEIPPSSNPTVGEANSHHFWSYLDQFCHNICFKIYVS